ncbi:MAG: hypothetical protein WBB31_13445 [Saprospiraceae bacterium]
MRNRGLIISFLVLIILGILIYINPGQFFTKALLRLTGDYATPEYETDASILSKTKSENLYYDRLYKIKNFKTFNEFQKKKLAAVPFVQIYNRNKQMITIASGNECSWALMNFFNKKDTLNLVAGDSLMYDYVVDRLIPIDFKTNADTFNYYVLSGWTNYLPKLSERLFAQTNKMRAALGDKVCFSYVNFDFQDEWKEEMDSLDRSKQ